MFSQKTIFRYINGTTYARDLKEMLLEQKAEEARHQEQAQHIQQKPVKQNMGMGGMSI